MTYRDPSKWVIAARTSAPAPDIEDAITALIDAHRWWRGKRTLTEQVIVDIIGVRHAAQRIADLAETHRLWCAYWATREERYVPALIKWLTDGSWRDLPPEEPEDEATRLARAEDERRDRCQ